MNIADYDRIADSLLAAARDIEIAKRPGYTCGHTDVLQNFKSVAARLPPCACGRPIEPGLVLAVYLLKHVDAIVSILCRPDLPVAEAPLGRFADNVNYNRLGFALVAERDEAASASSSPAIAPPAAASAAAEGV